MKAKQFFFTLTILYCTLLSCKKKSDSPIPEPYSSYISIQLVKPATLGSDSGKLIQIYLKNDSNKEFEKECIMSYSLQDTISGEYYHSENLFSNKQIPNLPNGVLNIPIKGTLFFNVDLRDLRWTTLDFENIKPNRYLLNAQLFIRDPYSPMNLIQSNRITIIK
jgi:hypothetical protein